MRWKIKRFTNDSLRQKFVDATVPQGLHLGLNFPDPDLHFDATGGHGIFGEIDWDEFRRVLAGDGPCNRERLAARRRLEERLGAGAKGSVGRAPGGHRGDGSAAVPPVAEAGDQTLELDDSDDVDENEEDGQQDEQRATDANDPKDVTADVFVLDDCAGGDQAAAERSHSRTPRRRCVAPPVAYRRAG